MKKVYIAGKFEKKDLILSLYEKIREKEFEVSYDWTTHKPIKPYAEHKDIAQLYSQNEIKGIKSCDVFIYLADEGGHTLPMEFGAALMHTFITGKPEKIFAVGILNDKSPWFFNPLVTRVDTIEEMIKQL